MVQDKEVVSAPILSNVDDELISSLDLCEATMGGNNEFRVMRNLVIHIYEYGYNSNHDIAKKQLSDLEKYVDKFPTIPLSGFISYVRCHPCYQGARLCKLLSLSRDELNLILDFFLDCSVMYGKFHMLTWRELYEQEPGYFRWCVAKSKMRQFNVERYVAFSALLMT
jgi:hypothetical protein